jgi:hypothetical protein
MGAMAMAAPILPGKEDAWAKFAGQLSGARKAEFEDFNTRHRLTDHRAWLQKNPDGSSLVIVVAEGPGAETLMGRVRDLGQRVRQVVHGEGRRGPRVRLQRPASAARRAQDLTRSPSQRFHAYQLGRRGVSTLLIPAWAACPAASLGRVGAARAPETARNGQ